MVIRPIDALAALVIFLLTTFEGVGPIGSVTCWPPSAASAARRAA